MLRSAWRLLKDSVNELLEGAPVSLDINALQRHLSREIPEVRNVHHVHVWMVGEKPVMTLHAQVIPPHDHDALLERIQDFLMHECSRKIQHPVVLAVSPINRTPATSSVEAGCFAPKRAISSESEILPPVSSASC